MSTRVQAPRGVQDILPEQQPYWSAIHDALREVARLYGYRRIDTPAFEYAALFDKGSGDTSDIVEKEMYRFEDRGGDLLALTPEATPAICRAYLEHGMASWPQPVRLYTTHAMFRYDRPQKGRYRQHTQFDCEVLGSSDPLIDAELITLLWDLYRRLGIRDVQVRLNSIDDAEPRRAYTERLKDFYRPHLANLSEDAQRRFERNPLRLLDSKDPRDQALKASAPKLVESLSPAAAEHHDTVVATLQEAGIEVVIDPLIVRGLDYYNRTVFEIVPKADERAQSTIGAGGRYDGLMQILGGPATPGVGFGSGIERIILEMQRCEVALAEPATADVFVIHQGRAGQRAALALAGDMRRAGVAAVVAESGRSFKSQFRSADASGARFALIVGENEAASGVAIVKDLRDGGAQAEVRFDQAGDAVAARLRGG
ncbi:MAG: histidine--tRNA ligase [Dehalococcoidia bacterium]